MMVISSEYVKFRKKEVVVY